MHFVDVMRILTFVTSICLTYGLYDQAWKAWNNKSKEAYSLPLAIFLVANETVWLTYGIAIREWPIIAICGINVPAVIWLMIAVAFKTRVKN